MTKLELFNVALALVAALVGFGALHRMNPKTELTIILAFTLISSGLLAQAFSTALSRWQTPFDTLLFGGAAALMIGTRRQTIWLAPAWMPWISLAVSVLTILAFLCGLES